MAKNYNACGITKGQGGAQPPPMFRTIPGGGTHVKGKNNLFMGG